MPALNKQTLINLLIDSPLREPIKINLIDIVNNTNDADLPKTYSTIAKELEIYQKATERRMKLAEETIAKLQTDGGAQGEPTTSATPAPSPTTLPPLPPMPPMPTPAAAEPAPSEVPAPTPAASDVPTLSVPPLDLPPLPTMKTETPAPTPAVAEPAPTPAAAPAPATASANADEDALKEIQKELDALKSSATADAAPAAPAPQV